MTNSPDISEALETILNARLVEVHTSFPGQVVSYDKSKQVANIRPMVKKAVLSSDINDSPDVYEELPILPNVPIRHARGGACFIHTPLKSGDFVWVHVTQNDFANWRTTGRLSEPSTPLTHDLSSCWAEPGAFPISQKLDSSKLSDTDITIVNGSTHISVTTSGLEINNDVDVEGTLSVGFPALDAPSLSSIVDTDINAIKGLLASWVPVIGDGGASLKAHISAWTGAPLLSASSKIKTSG
jgi:hypothetical protein